MTEIVGSCACGQVTYKIKGTVWDCCYCHCSICRKLSGSSAAAYGTVDRNQFEWTSGQEVLQFFQPTTKSKRHFCSRCSSFLLTEHEIEPDNVFVTLGTIDDQLNQKIEYRQFSKDRPAWSRSKTKIQDYPEMAG